MPIRAAMSKVTNWTLHMPAHKLFSQYAAVTSNKKMPDLDKLMTTHNHVSFMQYWAIMAPCKTHTQWKGKLMHKVPFEAIDATKGTSDCGRLLALAFFHQSEPGDEVSAEIAKGKAYFVEEGAEARWLSQ